MRKRLPALTKVYSRVFLTMLATQLFACSAPPTLPTDSYGIPFAQPQNAPPITGKVLILADNQLNYLFGNPVWSISAATDKISRVALRPVEQDMYSPLVLETVLRNLKDRFVIHLGDATNTACSEEYDRFTAMMTKTRAGSSRWVMAPGNHDAYLFGVTQDTTVNQKNWKAACRDGGVPLTKDLLVTKYLEQLRRQFPGFDRYLESKHGGRIPAEGMWPDNPENRGDGFLAAIAWKISTDQNEQNRSFVVQEINLTRKGMTPRISAILLDTTQYSSPPVTIPVFGVNAGLSGSILKDQMAHVERWAARPSDAGKRQILMGHHPYATLSSSSRELVDTIRARYRVDLYFSAHTHFGKAIVNEQQNGSNWLEINVGSITDWPIEFRLLTGMRDPKRPAEFIYDLSQQRIPGSDLLEKWQVAGQWPNLEKCNDFRLVVATTKWDTRSSTSSLRAKGYRMEDMLSAFLTQFEKTGLAQDGAYTWPRVCGPGPEFRECDSYQSFTHALGHVAKRHADWGRIDGGSDIDKGNYADFVETMSTMARRVSAFEARRDVRTTETLERAGMLLIEAREIEQRLLRSRNGTEAERGKVRKLKEEAVRLKLKGNKHRDYKICRAILSARFDAGRGLTPLVDDRYIRIRSISPK